MDQMQTLTFEREARKQMLFKKRDIIGAQSKIIMLLEILLRFSKSGLTRHNVPLYHRFRT